MSLALIQLLISAGGTLYQAITEGIKTAHQNKEISDAEFADYIAKRDAAFSGPEWLIRPDPKS